MIPASTSRWLAEVPRDAPVAFLVRHAERATLPVGEIGNEVPITEAGAHAATELGRVIGARLQSVWTSPVLRCVETAACMLRGAGARVAVTHDHLLGDPGVYIRDPVEAGQLWKTMEHEQIVAHLVSSNELLPGFAEPASAARQLVQHMLGGTGGAAGLHLFVTHDSVVTTTVAHVLDVQLQPADWPEYLEGAMFWRDGSAPRARYRDWSCPRPSQANGTGNPKKSW